jgi:hypothetical protein
MSFASCVLPQHDLSSIVKKGTLGDAVKANVFCRFPSFLESPLPCRCLLLALLVLPILHILRRPLWLSPRFIRLPPYRLRPLFR